MGAALCWVGALCTLGALGAAEEPSAEPKTPESSSVDAEDPVDAVSDETALCVAAVAEAVVDEELEEVANANVSATRAASVAVPVAMRVRRVEVMAPVVTGDLKSSVRVRLRRREAGSGSPRRGSRPIAVGMLPRPGEESGGVRAVRTERARAADRVSDLRARLGPPTQPLQLGDILVSQGALTRENLHRALAEQRRTAGRLGDVLVARGYVHRLDVYRALSDAWGIPHVDLSRHALDGDLIAELGLDVANLAGAPWVPLVREHGTLVVATTERPSPELEADVRVFAGPVGIAWMVTTEWDIRNAVLRSFGAELTLRASSDLAARAPDDSASRVVTRPQAVVLLAGLAALAAAGILAPLTTVNGIFLALNIAVVANVAFKALAIVAGFVRRGRRVVAEVPDVPDNDLPRYTVLVPAFGEANVIADLVEHLGHLDYPRDRLEVLLLLEEVDRADHRGRHGIGPAGVRAHRRGARRPAADQAEGVQRRPQLRARRVSRHLRRRGPARRRTSCARPWRRSVPRRREIDLPAGAARTATSTRTS